MRISRELFRRVARRRLSTEYPVPKINLFLLQGGPSSEHKVSLSSGAMVAAALDRDAYRLAMVTIQKNGHWTFHDSTKKTLQTREALRRIKSFRNRIVFVALHGAFGEDGRIQTLLEQEGISYTGSGPSASLLAMDKAASGILLERAGLRVPRFVRLGKGDDLEMLNGLRFPVIVKPCNGGSSIHLSVANNSKMALIAAKKILTTGDCAIVQERIKGREFTCGILDDEHGEPRALPPTEIIPKRGSIFDYEAKYTAGASIEITPARISKNLTTLLQKSALIAHRSLGCSGMSRSDFIWSRGSLYILETNTIPGMTATSLLPQAAKAAGIGFSQMLDMIINSALNKKP